ncbi:MAG TPA: AlpA family transcriptional regulator [Granulicella sp.]|jgi:prophage regulatory protein
METILRLPAVKACTGLSRSALYLKMARREFPQSIPLGERAVGWLQSDIESWQKQRIALGGNNGGNSLTATE